MIFPKYLLADLTHVFAAFTSVLLESGTMKRIYSNDKLKDGDNSDSSSIQSEDVSRGTRAREKFEALDETQKRKIYQLLDEWEEPDRTSQENVSALFYTGYMTRHTSMMDPCLMHTPSRCSHTLPFQLFFGSAML
jgi:hypothetical protein